MTDFQFDSKLSRDIKLPLVLLVVYIHCFGQPYDVNLFHFDWHNLITVDFYNLIRIAISKVLASVAVPLFFFASGYYFFSGAKKIAVSYFIQKFKKRISTLFIPYIFWIALYILLKCALLSINSSEPIEAIAEFINLKGGLLSMFWGCEVWNAHIVNVFGDYAINTAPILVPLWFLRDLMVVILLTPFIYYFSYKVPLMYVVILIIIDLLGLRAYFPIFPFYGFLFFSLGSCLSIHNISITYFISKPAIKYPAYALTLISFLVSIYLYGSSTVLEGIIYKVFRLFGSISFMNINIKFFKAHNSTILSKYSHATFFIYASHTFLGISIVSALFNLIFPLFPMDLCRLSEIVLVVIKILKYLLLPPIVVVFCIFLFRLFERFAPKWLFNLFNGGR